MFGSLLVGVILAAAAEYMAYGWLRERNPAAARRALRRHPWLGSSTVPPGGPQLHGERLNLLAFYPLLGWFPRPGRENRSARGFRVNDASETAALDPTAEGRIFLVGGSTVAGKRLPPRSTISAHLENLLRKRWGRRIDVVNAGVGGWSAANQLAFITGVLLPFFQPDAVVVLDGVNDVKRAVAAARLPNARERKQRASGILYDPTLQRHRRQLTRIRRDPGFVLNQLLHLTGVRGHLRADRYFTGAALSRLSGWAPPNQRARDRFEARLEHLQRRAPIRLPGVVRRRAAARIRALPAPKRRLLKEALARLSSRRKKIVLRGVGSAREATWQRLWPLQLRGSSSDVSKRLKKATDDYLPDAVDRFLHRQPCTRVPLNLRPYRSHVRTTIHVLSQRGVPVIYALQPSIFYKPFLTHAERQMVRRVRSVVYTRGMYLYDLPFRTCARRLYRRFFRRARETFETGPGAATATRRLDLSRLFRREKAPLFRDFVHYNNRGSRRIAVRLMESLETLRPRPEAP